MVQKNKNKTKTNLHVESLKAENLGGNPLISQIEKSSYNYYNISSMSKT